MRHCLLGDVAMRSEHAWSDMRRDGAGGGPEGGVTRNAHTMDQHVSWLAQPALARSDSLRSPCRG